MAYSYVGQIQNSSGSTGTSGVNTGSETLTVTTGDLLILVASYFSGSAQTVTWPTTWGSVVEIGNFFNVTDGAGVRWGYVENATGAAASNAAITFGANVDFPGLYVAQYRGLALSGALVANPSLNRQVNPGTGAGAVLCNATPSSQPCLLFGFSFAGNISNWVAGQNGTPRAAAWGYGSGVNFSAFPQDQRLTSTAATSSTWTANNGTDNFYSISIAFAEPGGGGTGYTLTADSGTYTVSGQAVNLVKTALYSLSAATGSYTIVGSDAQIDLAMAIPQGSYAVSGQAVALSFNGRTDYTVLAAQGSYTVVGQTVSLIYRLNSIVCNTGLYNVAGQSVTLLKNGQPTGGGDGISGQGVSGPGVSGLSVSGVARSPSGPPF